MTDGNSDSQSALPSSNTGFFNKFLIVLLNRSANTAPLSVKREYLLILLLIKNSLKILLTYSLPSSVSRRFGLRFDVLIICENASVID